MHQEFQHLIKHLFASVVKLKVLQLIIALESKGKGNNSKKKVNFNKMKDNKAKEKDERKRKFSTSGSSSSWNNSYLKDQGSSLDSSEKQEFDNVFHRSS